MERRQHIMVVDDDRNLLEIVGHALQLKGYNVSATTDGASALDLMEECQPDLVLLDIMMPELDGYQVLYLIRQRSTVPVIMLTAVNGDKSLKKAVLLGADDYVTKPFSLQVLTARIQAKLRRAKQGQAGYRGGKDPVAYAR